VVCLPKAGETVAGDAWGIVRCGEAATVLLADGLGHGQGAHAAAQAAIQTLASHRDAEPQALLHACHAALTSTRGAAASAVLLEAVHERGSFAGVGNVIGRIEVPGVSRRLVSYNGTLGHTVRKLQTFAFPFPPGAVLVLHSDGVASRWDLGSYPGLYLRHPALIAAILYRDYDRGRDDVTVVVIRNACEARTGKS
jgi:hypothetical protein